MQSRHPELRQLGRAVRSVLGDDGRRLRDGLHLRAEADGHGDVHGRLVGLGAGTRREESRQDYQGI